MPTYTSIVENAVEKYKVHELIIAGDLYLEIKNEVPETAFYKNLERMCKSKLLIHLTKGVYYKPKKSAFGEVPISTEQIVNYYIENYKGLEVGYKLYNKKGLTTQIGKKVEVLSNNLKEDHKNIGDVSVKKVDIDLDKNTVSTIEMLEVLQNYGKIENINNREFYIYFGEYSKDYSDDIANKVLKKLKYKKSTIAFFRKCLNDFGVENSLNEYLSSVSTYKIPYMEKMDEVTS